MKTGILDSGNTIVCHRASFRCAPKEAMFLQNQHGMLYWNILCQKEVIRNTKNDRYQQNPIENNIHKTDKTEF